MSDSMFNDQVAMERILYVIEESRKICDRSQFYSWAQGALQGLLPHEILLCICGELPSFRFSLKTFSTFAEDQQLVDKLTDPNLGLLNTIVGTWLSSGRKPLLYAASTDGAKADPSATLLRRIGCGYTLAHGASEIMTSAATFFVFLKMPSAPKSRQGYLIDLLMPHLHMALCRVLQTERDADSNILKSIKVLSAREEEVLRWVGQGKTNQEIGERLTISPLTVKNHVQKILRKLGVNNRAQAVFKANAAGAHPAPPKNPRGAQ